MDRREFIGSGLCAGAIAALPPSARAAVPDRAMALYDRIVADSFQNVAAVRDLAQAQ